jgi:hypothetical protein
LKISLSLKGRGNITEEEPNKKIVMKMLWKTTRLFCHHRLIPLLSL